MVACYDYRTGDHDELGRQLQTLQSRFTDFMPGYNKFRSVTFTIIIAVFAMPLLGFMGLEKIASNGLDKPAQKKLLIVLACTAGLCLFLILFGGFLFSFTRPGEDMLPTMVPDKH